jgi:hypothetical protein
MLMFLCMLLQSAAAVSWTVQTCQTCQLADVSALLVLCWSVVLPEPTTTVGAA